MHYPKCSRNFHCAGICGPVRQCTWVSSAGRCRAHVHVRGRGEARGGRPPVETAPRHPTRCLPPGGRTRGPRCAPAPAPGSEESSAAQLGVRRQAGGPERVPHRPPCCCPPCPGCRTPRGAHAPARGRGTSCSLAARPRRPPSPCPHPGCLRGIPARSQWTPWAALLSGRRLAVCGESDPHSGPCPRPGRQRGAARETWPSAFVGTRPCPLPHRPGTRSNPPQPRARLRRT